MTYFFPPMLLYPSSMLPCGLYHIPHPQMLPPVVISCTDLLWLLHSESFSLAFNYMLFCIVLYLFRIYYLPPHHFSRLWVSWSQGPCLLPFSYHPLAQACWPQGAWPFMVTGFVLDTLFTGDFSPASTHLPQLLPVTSLLFQLGPCSCPSMPAANQLEVSGP